MSTSQSNDIDIDRRLEQDRARDWRENFVDGPEPEGRWTEDEGFGSGAISGFPGLTPATQAYYERVVERMEEATGTIIDPFGDHRGDFDEHVKNCYVSGYPTLFAALQFARMKAGEPARTLSVPRFTDKDEQLFLRVGLRVSQWGEDEASFTGEELSDWLCHAETGPYEMREADEAEWPDNPGQQFSPAVDMRLVRLR